MNLFTQLEYFIHIKEVISSYMKDVNPISRRMLALGLIAQMQQLTEKLSAINETMDTSLSEEDAILSTYNFKRDFLSNDLFDIRSYMDDGSKDATINKMTDLFPLGHKDYSFSKENNETMKMGLHCLCNEDNIKARDLVFSLQKGWNEICTLLVSIDRKKHNIKDYQYEDFWYSFLYRDDDLIPERVFNDYDLWKENHDYENYQVLKDKRTQEILKLLKCGVFNYDITPVKRDINNCIIKISEDALEDGTDIPQNINIECARLAAYVTMKEDIMSLDYKKLGKYVYKNYRSLTDEQGDSLIYFDYMLLRIHDDMAECKPKLKKYLRFYEDDLKEILIKEACKIIDTCSVYIDEKTPKNFLKEYIKAAFEGDAKVEVQNNLAGQSKYTLICRMLGMLKSTLKVFKSETTAMDLAKELSTVVKKPKQESLKRYIDEGSSETQSKLMKWTKQYVIDKLGSKAESTFMKVANKKK